MNIAQSIPVTNMLFASLVAALARPAEMDEESIAILADKKPVEDQEGFLTEGDLMSVTTPDGRLMFVGRFGGVLRAIIQVVPQDAHGDFSIWSLNDSEYDDVIEVQDEMLDTESLKLFFSCFDIADQMVAIVERYEAGFIVGQTVVLPASMTGLVNDSNLRHPGDVTHENLYGNTPEVSEGVQVTVERTFFDATKGGSVDEVKVIIDEAVTTASNDPTMGSTEAFNEHIDLPDPHIVTPNKLREAIDRVRNVRQSKYVPTAQTIAKVVVGAIVVYAGLKIYNKLAH